jgi:ABC-2 type transport system permease protein
MLQQSTLLNLRSDARLYLRLVGARIRSQMQYRASFLMMLVVTTLGLMTEFIAVLLLFNRFEVLAGWDVGEVALLYGLTSMAFGICEMVGAGFDVFPNTIRRGEFDQVLVRPAGVFVQVMAADFQLRRLGRIFQGATAFGLGVYWTSVDWSLVKVLYLMLVLGSGAVLFTALLVLGATLCFWTVQSIELINIFTYGGTEMTSYPLPIYHLLMQRFFTYIVPLAFVSYYPAVYLLNRPELATTPGWFPFMPPVAALGLAVVSRVAWGFGVRHYRSTGS